VVPDLYRDNRRDLAAQNGNLKAITQRKRLQRRQLADNFWYIRRRGRTNCARYPG
jgi:hypothetical protein